MNELCIIIGVQLITQAVSLVVIAKLVEDNKMLCGWCDWYLDIAQRLMREVDECRSIISRAKDDVSKLIESMETGIREDFE